MSRHGFAWTLITWLSLTLLVGADEHRVEVLKEPPPKAELAESMQDQFAAQGLRVVRGTSRTVCELWPCKSWDVAKDFEPTVQRLYPFQPGQLIGLLHFTRRGNDFRDQPIDRGWYTLRFGLQPVDGNHVGTSPTLDFLLMVPAEKDTSPKPLDAKQLLAMSAEAAGATHPAMMCLQPVSEEVKQSPAIYHDEARDWWILRFAAKAGDGAEAKEQPVDLVVVGHADE